MSDVQLDIGASNAATRMVNGIHEMRQTEEARLAEMGHDIERQQVWMRAWCAVATATNCTSPDQPRNWADKCLEAFEERFMIDNRNNLQVTE